MQKPPPLKTASGALKTCSENRPALLAVFNVEQVALNRHADLVLGWFSFFANRERVLYQPRQSRSMTRAQFETAETAQQGTHLTGRATMFPGEYAKTHAHACGARGIA